MVKTDEVCCIVSDDSHWYFPSAEVFLTVDIIVSGVVLFNSPKP